MIQYKPARIISYWYPMVSFGLGSETLDATPDKDITLYCNTGYRSAHAYLALRLLDYRRDPGAL